MFNVGGMELLVIAVVALVVLGPDKLPGAIRQIGQVTGELRRISQGFQTDLRGALDDAEREADASRRVPDTGTAPPDPGAARAVARAELAAIENTTGDDTTGAANGSASSGDDDA